MRHLETDERVKLHTAWLLDAGLVLNAESATQLAEVIYSLREESDISAACRLRDMDPRRAGKLAAHVVAKRRELTPWWPFVGA